MYIFFYLFLVIHSEMVSMQATGIDAVKCMCEYCHVKLNALRQQWAAV